MAYNTDGSRTGITMDLSLQNYDNTGTALSFLRSTAQPSISLVKDVNTTPNGIAMNPTGLAYNNGTTTTSTSWDTLSNKIASLSAVAPNSLNASLLVVNETISIQNEDTAPTRVINTSAGSNIGGEHFGVAWVGNTLPFVMETLDATDLVVQDTILNVKQGGGGTNQIILNSSSATITITDGTNTNTLTPTPYVPDLNAVLTAGANAGGQSITNVNDIACSSINSTSYPPPTPNLTSVLGAGNSASGYDILSVNNLQTNYINGLTPTTIGLTWADFNGTQAQVNLPNNRYEVGSGTATSWLNQGGFYCSSGSNNMTINDSILSQYSSGAETIRLDPNGGSPTLRLGQLGSGGASQSEVFNYTITQRNQSYGTGYSWEGKLTAEADAGFHIRSWETNTSTLKPILLECSQLVLNGTPLSVIQSAKGQAYGSSTWSIGNGSWYNISSSNSFNFTAGTGWTGYKSFQISFNFNCFTSHENTGVLYIEIRDSAGNLSVPYSINTSYPCYATGGSSFTGSYTQFNFTDTIQLNNTTGSETFYLDIYLGHNGGTWSGSSLWGLNMIAIN